MRRTNRVIPSLKSADFEFLAKRKQRTYSICDMGRVNSISCYAAGHTENRVANYHKWSGLLVGTKLGTTRCRFDETPRPADTEPSQRCSGLSFLKRIRTKARTLATGGESYARAGLYKLSKNEMYFVRIAHESNPMSVSTRVPGFTSNMPSRHCRELRRFNPG